MWVGDNMLLNIIVGFIIPWVFIINLWFKDKEVLLIVAPFQSFIAYTVNAIGFYCGFWNLYPFGNEEIVHVPFDVGIYPMLSSYMIYYVKNKKNRPFIVIFIFTLITTCIEGIGVVMGRVVYGGNWNIVGTFISYLIPYILNYVYYFYLKKSIYNKNV